MCTRTHVRRKSVVYYQYDTYLELFFPNNHSNDNWRVLEHLERLLGSSSYL